MQNELLCFVSEFLCKSEVITFLISAGCYIGSLCFVKVFPFDFEHPVMWF